MKTYEKNGYLVTDDKTSNLFRFKAHINLDAASLTFNYLAHFVGFGPTEDEAILSLKEAIVSFETSLNSYK